MKPKALFIVCFLMAICANSCQMLRCNAGFNVKKSVFQAGSKSYTFSNIPAGYLSKDIRIVKGDGDDYSLLIYYQDSSLLYFCVYSSESPNYYNIKNLNTPASKWRIYAKFFLATPQSELESDFLNSHPDSCLYSWGEILSFGPKDIIDLNGNNERGEFWRDIQLGESCIGYITRNTNRINDFDAFLNDNIKSLKDTCEQ